MAVGVCRCCWCLVGFQHKPLLLVSESAVLVGEAGAGNCGWQ